MIEARISKRYSPRPDSTAFSLDLSLTSSAGVTVLFGPSGAGKTLTLDCIAGFVRPDQGRIVLDGTVLFDSASGIHLAPRDRHAGYVFQNYALFPHMTMRQNLAFAAKRLPQSMREPRVNKMLENFRLMGVAGRRPHEVSGGEKQRASIARALIGEPRLLLLDEPARGLDAPLRAEFYAVLRQVRAEFDTPAVLVTHDLKESFELGDEMLVVREGRVVQSGPPRAILEQPANIEVARLLGCYNLMQVEIGDMDPDRNRSQLRYEGFDITGPYFPGHSIGDRKWLCTRPELLIAHSRTGPPGANEIAAKLLRVVDIPSGKRLEFSGDIAVESAKLEEDVRPLQDWVIEFPPRALILV